MWTERPKIVPDRPFPPPSPAQIQRLRDRTSIQCLLLVTVCTLHHQQVYDSSMKLPDWIHISVSLTIFFTRSKRKGLESNIKRSGSRPAVISWDSKERVVGATLQYPSLKPFGGSTLSIRHFQMHFCHSQVGTQASIYLADVSRICKGPGQYKFQA